jgi:FMN phosphatase YigB (HAD superfamily)
MVLQPPLFPRVLFIDWHGVLSSDPFWSSIRGSHTHPLRRALEQRVSAVLADDVLSTRWMTGGLSTAEVVGPVAANAPWRYRSDFLIRRVEEDVARMHVNEDMIGALQALRTRVAVVLATDNMDCFAATFRARHALRAPRGATASTLARYVTLFDDLICSSDVGTLKARDPVGFFGGWLQDAGLGFADAALVDDRADNCAAFRGCSGQAVQWRAGDSVDRLVAEVAQWAASPDLPVAS